VSLDDLDPFLPAHNSDLFVPCTCGWPADPLCENCGGQGWTEESA
jgi:hypothetical protein